MSGADVNPAYSNRPSPCEPWRYACPACSSVCVEVTLGKNREAGERFMGDRGGVRRSRAKRYMCQECGERHAAVVDTRTGIETTNTPRP